jgi:excisionase family DNA binding protein
MKLLTVAEAALALHVSQATVRKLVARKFIRHERIGLGRGSIRLPEDALAEYRLSVTVPAETNGGGKSRKTSRPHSTYRNLPF